MKFPGVGQTSSLTWVAEKRYCIERGAGLWVFSTPSLVWLMEHACADMLLPALGSGRTSVGTYVAMRHLAPSGLGARVTAHVTLVEVDRRRFGFTASVYDGERKVGEGTHERFVVDTDKYEEKIRGVHP